MTDPLTIKITCVCGDFLHLTTGLTSEGPLALMPYDRGFHCPLCGVAYWAPAVKWETAGS